MTDPVQLGHVDVEPAVLDGGGLAMWDLLGPADSLIVKVADETMRRLPATGWRRIAGSSGGREVLAAPLPSPRRWAVLSVAVDRDGRRLLSANPDVTPIPGRAVRGRGLTLTIPDGLVSPAGTVPEDIEVELRNTGDRLWTNDHADGATVGADLLDADGHHDSGHWSSSSTPKLPDLAPGAVVLLPVQWSTGTDWATTVPGEVTFVARVLSLFLRSAPGTLRLR